MFHQRQIFRWSLTISLVTLIVVYPYNHHICHLRIIYYHLHVLLMNKVKSCNTKNPPIIIPPHTPSSTSSLFKSIHFTLVFWCIIKNKTYEEASKSIKQPCFNTCTLTRSAAHIISINDEVCHSVQSILTHQQCDYVLLPLSE